MLKLFRYLADKTPFAADAPADAPSDTPRESQLARDSELAAMPSTFASLQPAGGNASAPTPAASPDSAPADSSPWSRLRSGEPHSLAESTFAWALDLPRAVRPTQLLVRYPRVANRIAVSWGDPRLTDRVFDSLARNTREGRRGFPPHVAEELRLLHEHHDTTRHDAKRREPPPAARAAAFPAAEPTTQPTPLSTAYDDAWAAQATSDR